jgi:nitrous oxidase accessory protein
MGLVLVLCTGWPLAAPARSIVVGAQQAIKTITQGVAAAQAGDTIWVEKGFYKEGNILINKKVHLRGKGLPIVDGDKKYEVFSVKSSGVSIQGFRIQHSGIASLDDPGGIKVYDSEQVSIENNELYNNFFGIYLQYSKNCLVKNNRILAYGKEEQSIGNGIHCWKSDSLQIIGNSISGHRDGIYFEFVTHSVIWRNISINNVRYGLHFMFSNDDAYFTNYFARNGAGVAVMFTKNVVMMNNTFSDNWGDAAYGLLFKEISDCLLIGNTFVRNTAGVFMDGTNRFIAEKNSFSQNGWAFRIQANCMDNNIRSNEFRNNTFDVSTNGNLTLNFFDQNYWDKYQGYDLNKDKFGDVPHHPLSLFSMITETQPAAMILFRSFMVKLLDESERKLPTLTPDQFQDPRPRMKPFLQ